MLYIWLTPLSRPDRAKPGKRRCRCCTMSLSLVLSSKYAPKRVSCGRGWESKSMKRLFLPPGCGCAGGRMTAMVSGGFVMIIPMGLISLPCALASRNSFSKGLSSVRRPCSNPGPMGCVLWKKVSPSSSTARCRDPRMSITSLYFIMPDSTASHILSRDISSSGVSRE